MPKTAPFEKYTQEYENWFEENRNIYLSELNAVKEMVPKGKKGVEIGVGTGRFAEPLGIKIGVEPSRKMADVAKTRGISVVEAAAENLPFKDSEFDFVLMVTTICFVDNIADTLKESYRILKQNGYIINAFVDKNSKLGQIYQKKREKSKFYRESTFYSVDEIIEHLTNAGFRNFKFRQTVFDQQNQHIQASIEGYGEGSFIVVRGLKP